MRKQVILSLVLLFTLSLFYSQLCFSQEHPLAGKNWGSLIFMKNLTTDDQADYSNDTCWVLETSKSVIPDIWVRAFLKNNIQYYIDYMKKKHDKITYMNFLIGYTITPFIYKDGKMLNKLGTEYAHKCEEKINIDNFNNYNTNTLLLKFSDFEHFVKAFNFRVKEIKKDETLKLRISCTLKFVCTYVNVLEKTKTDLYKDDKGWDIVAILSEEVGAQDYSYFNLFVK